jgi:hypothetical protein
MPSITDTMIPMNIIITGTVMSLLTGRENGVTTMRNPADPQGVGAENAKVSTEVGSTR